MIFYQDCSSHLDSSKNMAARGRGLFSLYIYIENFKNLLVRNQGPISILLGRNVSLVTLYQDCSSRHDLSKNMAARGQVLFSLCIYIETFNALLVRNHWTYFKIALQECFLCNSLSRLFKQSWFVKKHGRQGAGLIFPMYLYRKLKKIFLSETTGPISL